MRAQKKPAGEFFPLQTPCLVPPLGKPEGGGVRDSGKSDIVIIWKVPTGAEYG